MLSCSERTMRSSPAGFRRRLLRAARSFRSCSSLALISSRLIVARNRSSAFFDISRRRNSHSSRSRPGVRISSADPASLPDAPRTPTARCRISTQRACSCSNRFRSSPGNPASITTERRGRRGDGRRRPLRGVDLGVDGGTEARQRRERSQIRELAGEHERKRDVRQRAIAAPASPPRNNSMFHRKKNASFR